MAKQYKSMAIEYKLLPIFRDCEKLYRKNRPELDLIELTNSKILLEIMRYYLRNTEFKINDI